jgi:hypothetical protein
MRPSFQTIARATLPGRLPAALGIVPLFALSALSVAGLRGLVIFLVSLPAGALLARLVAPQVQGPRDALTGLPLRDGLVDALDRVLASARPDEVTGALLLEIDGINKQTVESKAEVAKLMAELKEKQIPPDKKPPAVVVQPSGSGQDAGQKLYFVEASGGKLSFTVDSKKVNVAATEEAIIGNVEFNHFLTEVKKAGNAQLIFLLRSDGTGAYSRGGGWAQDKYNIKISRLLLPGMGDVDLKLFGDRLGVVGAPPADFAPPPPAAPKP